MRTGVAFVFGALTASALLFLIFGSRSGPILPAEKNAIPTAAPAASPIAAPTAGPTDVSPFIINFSPRLNVGSDDFVEARLYNAWDRRIDALSVAITAHSHLDTREGEGVLRWSYIEPGEAATARIGPFRALARHHVMLREVLTCRIDGIAYSDCAAFLPKRVDLDPRDGDRNVR